MKNIQDYQQDIASIRSAMERSVKFISLSGLSGVLAGVYAVLGSSLTYYLVYYPHAPFGAGFHFDNEKAMVVKLAGIALTVLLLSIGTAILLSAKKGKKLNVSIWNKSSQQLVGSLMIPLVTGGLLILLLLLKGYFDLIAPACLIFYGLALIQASPYMFNELRFLGFTEILLGLTAAWLPGFGLILWATGFGLLHIVYGFVMHYRYDK